MQKHTNYFVKSQQYGEQHNQDFSVWAPPAGHTLVGTKYSKMVASS